MNIKKNKDRRSWDLNALDMKKEFWFASNVEHLNFASMDPTPKNILTIQTIVFFLWFFKKKEYNLKKIPFTWVAPLMCFHRNTNALGPIPMNPTMEEMEDCFVWGLLEGGNL